MTQGDDASVKLAATDRKKKARKSRTRRHPYVLQYRYTRDVGGLAAIMPSEFGIGGKWKVWSTYKTARSRDEALAAQLKGDNHGFSSGSCMEWRAIDRKA